MEWIHYYLAKPWVRTGLWVSIAIKVLISVSVVFMMAQSYKASAESGISLQDLRTFELYELQGAFTLDTNRIRPEIYSYVATALDEEDRLQKAQPADGVIVLNCGGTDCHHINVVVHHGSHDGPVIWKTKVGTYSLFLFERFWSEERKPQKIAEKIIKRLVTAYQMEKP